MFVICHVAKIIRKIVQITFEWQPSAGEVHLFENRQCKERIYLFITVSQNYTSLLIFVWKIIPIPSFKTMVGFLPPFQPAVGANRHLKRWYEDHRHFKGWYKYSFAKY